MRGVNSEQIAASRAPLDAAGLASELVRPGGLWRTITVTEATGSTNADLLAQAAAGAPEGTVLTTDTQTAGRGRMGRTWLSPPGAALMFSVLLRPTAVPPARRGWLPLLAGVAITSALRGLTGLDVGLKWPNDVLIGDGKLAGILAEQSADAIVAGAGINVSTQRSELPVETATSLLLAGPPDLHRGRLLCAVLAEFERLYLAWSGPGAAGPGDPDAAGLRERYRDCCVTLGRQVRAELPGGGAITGTALDVDEAGSLRVDTPDGPRTVSAADIVHLR
jgi:BirA family transcriptional regulator, biotin operon repressor / biotin---[acetyl-CoA-carboxylase] ligase